MRYFGFLILAFAVLGMPVAAHACAKMGDIGLDIRLGIVKNRDQCDELQLTMPGNFRNELKHLYEFMLVSLRYDDKQGTKNLTLDPFEVKEKVYAHMCVPREKLDSTQITIFYQRNPGKPQNVNGVDMQVIGSCLHSIKYDSLLDLLKESRARGEKEEQERKAKAEAEERAWQEMEKARLKAGQEEDEEAEKVEEQKDSTIN